LFTSPSRFSFGTRAFVNTISRVSEAWMPSFFSFLLLVTPAPFASTMNAEIPRGPSERSLAAYTTSVSAGPALVTNSLVPLSTK
jgi:hypothetical protein